MLVCYLDDSGKDPQNPITTIAGYVASETDWRAFEEAVEPIFQRYDVPVFHATDLHNTKGCFKGWSAIKKESFVAQICREMNDRIMLGVSMSALKGTYILRAAESERKRSVTPYTFCFNVVNDWLLRDYRTGKAVWTHGLAYVVESGHENNAEAKISFQEIKALHHLEETLGSMSFVEKSNCRAVQMADLLAFYSRRHGVSMLKEPPERREARATDRMLKIVTEVVPHRAFVATDFGEEIGSRFLAGDL